jgi:photosystem II stability/assembly factor-like uncharacterized protein
VGLATAVVLGASGRHRPAPQAMVLVPQSSGTDAQLFAVSPVNENVVWVSGARGTWLRTADGGAHWTLGTIPGADSLQFRDVKALSERTAFYLSIGNGPRSRIYRTDDAGATWTLQFQARDSAVFLDCIDFWDTRHGIAVGDAIDSSMVLYETIDGGAQWSRIPPGVLPAARPGDGSFATSGRCLVVRSGGRAWIAASTRTAGRVLRSADYGRTWHADSAPFGSLTALAFRDARHGYLFSGISGDSAGGIAASDDGGATWRVTAFPAFIGGAYAGAVVPSPGFRTVVAVGLRGSAWSADGGGTWTPLDTNNYWGVAFASRRAGWAVGKSGRIVRLGWL